MSRLDRMIFMQLKQKTNLKDQSIRNRISEFRRKYPNTTLNACAQLFALEKGFSILQRLSDEDKQSLPNLEMQTATIRIKRTKKKNTSITKLLKYESNSYFMRAHVDELNRAYSSKCLTSVYILLRKIIENIIIDILRTHFPPKTKENKELYYDIDQRRYKDFSILLKNLYDKRHDYPCPFGERAWKTRPEGVA